MYILKWFQVIKVASFFFSCKLAGHDQYYRIPLQLGTKEYRPQISASSPYHVPLDLMASENRKLLFYNARTPGKEVL